MNAADHAPFILTAAMDAPAFARFDALRRAYFPPERNFIPAHVTLFHALPPSAEAEIANTCRALARDTAPLPAETTGVYSLGRGVAYRVHAPALEKLREELADRWRGLLSAQDTGRIRPHVTVQNKVEPRDAKALLAELGAAFTPWRFHFTGLELWRYRGGPWDPAGRFAFRRA